MADVSIYVAVITGSAALVGALASPLAISFREGQQAKRDHQRENVAERRQAYLAVLGSAMQLRTQVANYYEYNKGPSLQDRLAELRKLAADAEINAVHVRLLVAGELGTLAGRLASAATELAKCTEQDTEQDLNAIRSGSKPKFDDLDACARNFRQAVTADIEG